MPKKWTEEEFDLAFSLHLKGQTYREIGARLGRSTRSVQRKMEYQGVAQKRQTTPEDRQVIKEELARLADKLDLPMQTIGGAIRTMYDRKEL